MTRRVAIAAMAIMTTTGAAHASPASCGDAITAKGVATFVEGSGDWTHYKGRIPPGLAKRRAIDNWQANVKTLCPHDNPRWWISRAKNLECEGAAGHEICTATAIPARKLIHLLKRE